MQESLTNWREIWDNYMVDCGNRKKKHRNLSHQPGGHNGNQKVRNARRRGRRRKQLRDDSLLKNLNLDFVEKSASFYWQLYGCVEINKPTITTTTTANENCSLLMWNLYMDFVYKSGPSKNEENWLTKRPAVKGEKSKGIKNNAKKGTNNHVTSRGKQKKFTDAQPTTQNKQTAEWQKTVSKPTTQKEQNFKNCRILQSRRSRRKTRNLPNKTGVLAGAVDSNTQSKRLEDFRAISSRIRNRRLIFQRKRMIMEENFQKHTKEIHNVSSPNWTHLLNLSLDFTIHPKYKLNIDSFILCDNYLIEGKAAPAANGDNWHYLCNLHRDYLEIPSVKRAATGLLLDKNCKAGLLLDKNCKALPNKFKIDIEIGYEYCKVEKGIKAGSQYVAIDCEMVEVGGENPRRALARVSIVDQNYKVLLDKFVKPLEIVTNYKTKFSGIRPEDIENGEDFYEVQKEVKFIINDKILVGHGLENDLKVLKLYHPYKNRRDTSTYPPLRWHSSKGRTPSLKLLSKRLLGLDIQSGEHCSVEDAQAVMRVFKTVRQSWDNFLMKNRKPHGHGFLFY